jgi:hypothetical protein
MTTWVRRWLIAAACSGTLLATTAGLAFADPDPSAGPGSSPGASPGSESPAADASTAATPHDRPPGLPTDDPTEQPTDNPTAPEPPQPSDDPTTDPAGTPPPPEDTDITQSVAVPVGEGQVGVLDSDPPAPVPPPAVHAPQRAAGSAVGGRTGLPPADLAATGVRVAVPLGIAAVLLLTGAAAQVAGRRRYNPSGSASAGRN